MAVATPTDVSNLTGEHVGEADIVRAQGVVEVLAGRPLQGKFSKRDRYWLKSAVAYQAAWMQSHPELFSMMDVTSMTQLDLSVNFRENPEAALVAPLARKALTRVGWKGTKTISIQSDFQRSSRWEDGPFDHDDVAWKAI